MITELSEEDIKYYTYIGKKRNHESIRKKLKSKKISKYTDEEIDIAGAGGELAVIRAFKLPNKLDVNTFKTKADIGKKWEVRTGINKGGYLIIRKKDNPELIYILVNNMSPTKFSIIGWMQGKEAMQNKYIRDDYSWFVPAKDLHPMEEIPSLV